MIPKLFVTVLLCATWPAHSAGSMYPYNDKTWNGMNAVCTTGKEQSPIDLPVCSVAEVRNLEVSYHSEPVLTELNHSHGVKIQPYNNTGLKMKGMDGNDYTLAQCHYHHGAEHTVGGVQHDAVCHCVHTRDDDSGRYGVLGFALKVGSTENELLKALGTTLPKDGEPSMNVSIDFTTIPKAINKTAWWSYKGSLTTPPCTEAVDWHFMMEPVSMTQNQFDLLKAAIGYNDISPPGNFRPPQPLHGRVVKGCSSSSSGSTTNTSNNTSLSTTVTPTVSTTNAPANDVDSAFHQGAAFLVVLALACSTIWNA